MDSDICAYCFPLHVRHARIATVRLKNILRYCFLVVSSPTVKSLTCNTCDVSVLGLCVSDTPVKCTNDQKKCYSAVARKLNS